MRLYMVVQRRAKDFSGMQEIATTLDDALEIASEWIGEISSTWYRYSDGLLITNYVDENNLKCRITIEPQDVLEIEKQK